MLGSSLKHTHPKLYSKKLSWDLLLALFSLYSPYSLWKKEVATKHWLWISSLNLLFLYIPSVWAISIETNKCLWVIPWFPQWLWDICKFLNSLQNKPRKKARGRKQVIQYIHPVKFIICIQLLFVEKTIRKDFPMEKEHKDCKPKELCMRRHRGISLYSFH